MLHNRCFGHPKSSRKSASNRRACLQLEPLEDRLVPATITVTSTADNSNVDGSVSLREALASINAGANINADVIASGAYGSNDKINFAIQGTNVHTIKPTTALPFITHSVTISGYTQAGSSFNTSALGDNAKLNIVLDGGLAGGGVNGLAAMANNCAILGLVIEHFASDAIYIIGNNTTIQGNFIGTDVTGKVAAGNGLNGIELHGMNNLIGGPLPLERNLVSGNVEGIAALSSIKIVNNIVGLDSSGQKMLGNDLYGVLLYANDNTLGDTAAGSGNIISGNKGPGVVVRGSFNKILGNFIGTNANGDNLGNGDFGILLNGGASNNFIGGPMAGMGNLIAFNSSAPPASSAKAGIASDVASTGLGNAFLGNLIYSNNGPAIDLGENGVTPNDPEDVDTGLNGLQNYPVLNVAEVQNTGSSISGTFNSTPGGAFRLEFFVNGSASYLGLYLGSILVYTDANGNAPVFFSTNLKLPTGTVSATATDSGPSTSEYSAPVAITTGLKGDAAGFVSSVFLDMLHRLPDNGGLSYFANQITDGVPLAQVIQAIQNNNEYRGIVVTDLYNLLLNRAPDPLGLLVFSNQLAQGTTVEQIEVTMMGSAEYYQNRGGSTSSGFIAAAFNDLLGRAPDSGAQTYFAGLLSGGASRAAVAQQLVGSQEAAQNTVDELFQKYLHRHADPGGKTYFGNLLVTGQVRDEQLAVMLTTSGEYYTFF
jgi:hypothetical protein